MTAEMCLRCRKRVCKVIIQISQHIQLRPYFAGTHLSNVKRISFFKHSKHPKTSVLTLCVIRFFKCLYFMMLRIFADLTLILDISEMLTIPCDLHSQERYIVLLWGPVNKLQSQNTHYSRIKNILFVL